MVDGRVSSRRGGEGLSTVPQIQFSIDISEAETEGTVPGTRPLSQMPKLNDSTCEVELYGNPKPGTRTEFPFIV